jgi:hypothetical protein
MQAPPSAELLRTPINNEIAEDQTDELTHVAEKMFQGRDASEGAACTDWESMIPQWAGWRAVREVGPGHADCPEPAG